MQATTTMLSFPYCSQFNNGGRSSSVTGSPVGSPSPPLTLYGHPYADHGGRYGSASPPTSTSSLPLCLKTNYHSHQRMPNVTASSFRKTTNGKSSFTIEAILGLQQHTSDDDEDIEANNHRGRISSATNSSLHYHHHHHGHAEDQLYYKGETGVMTSTAALHSQHPTSSHLGLLSAASTASGTGRTTGNYFNGHNGGGVLHHGGQLQSHSSRFQHNHHHLSHHQTSSSTSLHHHHHHVPVVDPYICTTQQLSPPCLSPDSTRKDKPSPLRRSYQSQHSPNNSGADSDQSSSTTGSSGGHLQNRLTPKITSGNNNNTNGSTGQHSPSISSAKSKRVRTIFTPEQLERLEREFERQQYMVGPERLYLASALQLSEAQVKVWFQNRRIKWRKQHLEMQQARLAKFRGGSDSEESQMTTEDVLQDV